MANKILSESFKVFTKYGYNDSIDDFVKLVNSNPDALNDAYEQYKNDAGFEGTIEEYAAALNQKPATVKKKEQEPSGMELPSEDGSSEQSTPQQPEPPKKPRTYGTLNLPGIAGALRTGQPSAKELAAIGEFAKKTEVKKEKPIEPKRPKLLLVDPTLAAIPQRDVLRESPALTSKEQIQKKVAEAAEDAKATEQYKEKQRILTTLQFARDKEKEFEQRKEREQEAAELIANADFNKDIEDATISIADKGAEQVASDLSKTMGKYGFSFTGVKTMLYPAIIVTGKRVGGETPTLELVLIDKDAQQKLKSFMQQYASKPYQFTPTDNQIDAEGQQFYASRGLDYKNERERQQRYYDVRDERMAAESIDPDDPTTYNETMRQKFPNLFLSSGAPRRDMSQVASDLLAEEDRLYATVFDKGVSRDTREQWDVQLEKKRKEAAATAAIKNNVAKNVIKDVNSYLVENLPGLAEIPSTGLYTQPIEKLMKYKPKTQAEADIANEAIRKYKEAIKVSKEAADQYQLSQLYFDEKVNKAVQGEYVDNLEGIYKSIHDGWQEGKTGAVLTLVSEGLYDRTDITSAKEAAQIIVDAQLAKYNQQSAVMGRADAAVSTREYLDAILEDPFEYVTTLFGTSVAQMLPTFAVIAPQTIVGGAAIGGLTSGTPQGAIAGAVGGLKRAQELTEFAVEIGSAFGEAMKENNLDILNPNDVATALNSDAVWGQTIDLGYKRGVAIALTQAVANKIAGRVFKVDDYASQVRKAGTQVAERFVVDPITEGAGEAVAQLVTTGDIDWKEVSGEALGGTFSNVTGMAANIYMDTQGKANIEIADNLTNIDYVANETASDERISNWANNMHRLGKIDADVNQRIQENIGHKRSAENLLDVGADKRERKDKSPLVARMMKLLAAEKELSSTEERRKVFSEKLSAIRKEQAYIADKQQLAPDDAKVDVDAIIKEQPQPGNYSYNGRRMTKAQFTERIEKMSPQKLANAVARKRLLVTGDPEVVKTINDKLNAVQKQTTGEVPVQPEARVGEEMAKGTPKAEPQVTTEEGFVYSPEEVTGRIQKLEEELATDVTPERKTEAEAELKNMRNVEQRLQLQDKVAQSLSSVYPDVKISTFNSAKEMEDYVAKEHGQKMFQTMMGGEGGMIIMDDTGKPTEILINNDVADATTMPHEAWHGLLIKAFGEDPKLFGEFRDAINKTLRDNGFGDIADELDKFVEEGQYEGDAMAEEWLVQFGGMLVAKGIDPSNLKPKERTLLEQIKDIINQFAERITGQPLFLKDATPENILDFMVAISEKMSKGESVAQFFEGTEERAPARKVKKQIIGEKAQLAQNVRDNLQVARDMEEAGKDVKTIRLATGWERGADGVWRYEIPEGEYKRNLFTIIKEKTTGLKIKDVYQNKELYRSYPQLADIPFETRKLEVGDNGFFDGNRIVLNETLVTDDAGSTREKVAMSTIIHELQHVIQDIEGFVRGGSPEATVDLLSKNLEVLNDSILNTEEYVNKYGWDKWTKITGETKEMLESDKSLANTISKELVKADAYGKFDLYKRLAGEVEARNVERRMGMTPEQRRQVPLVETEDVARESQVFMNLSGVIQPPKAKFSRKKTMVIDGKEVELVNAVEELLGGEEKKVKFSRKAPALQTVEATAKALDGVDVSKISEIVYIPQVLEVNELDKIPRGETFQEKYAPEYFAKLKEDIKNNGIKEPITLKYYVKDNAIRLMEGHHRLKIAKELGIDSIPVKVNVVWGASIKDGNEDIKGKPIVSPPTPINTDKYSKRNYAPSNIKIQELGYKNKSISEAYHAAKKDGSNPELVNAVEELLGGEEKKVKFSRKKKVDLSGLQGYNELVDTANQMKQDGSNLDTVLAEIEKLPAYENATDIQREEIVRQMRELFGEKEKRPPSVAKLLGITDKKIEIKEKTALANQLKAEARGARNAVKAWKDRAKLLADELKQLKGSNKINQSQYIAALRALVKVNIFNEDSISKFVDYVTKVINNAEYAKQIADLRKALPVAKKNVDRKLGMQPNLQAVLKKVFAVSPSMIPDAVFDKYVNLVNMIGERARVLNLDEQSSIMADATAIATMIDHEQFLAQMLKDAFDNYRDKVLDSNGDVDYQKTIEKMVSDGIIQPSDIELMKKYKGVIVPKEPKTEAEIQAEAAEREQERQDFISSIPGQTVTPSNLSTPDEKAGAKELIELSKDEQVLERMTLEQLRNLDKVLDNIANGFYPAYAHTLKEVMNGIKSSEGVRKAMPKIKIPAIRSMIGKLKAALMKGENMYYHVLSKVPLYIIDQQLGNYKTSPIYKNIFEKVAIAQSKLVSKQKQLLSQLDKAADAVFKEARRDPDKARMSEYRIFTYLLHREFMSNPGAKGVADAVNFIKATIEYHEENGDTAQVNSRDVEMLQKILDQYESNGKLDFAKLERSLTPKERAYVDALDKVNNEVYPMAEYTASVLRGESVPMLNNYVHHRVLPSKKAVGEQPNELMKANQRMNPSSRSGSLISREPGVKPLNFKVFSTQKAAVNSVLVDRFMTEPIRTTRRMFESLKRSLKDDGMLRGHNRDIVAALEMAFEKANEALLTNNLMYDTFMDEVISSVRRDAYRALLARPTRAIVEYASNLSAALTKSTGAFIDGMSMKGAMSQEELGAFMYSVNSTQISRVMPSSGMSSKFIDFGATGPAIGRQGSTANSSLANRMQTIYNRTLRRYKGGVDSVADALISTPDKAVSQPVWTGSFYNQFKKITGVNPDKDKIISGDEAYMERYKDAIKSATEKADEEVFMLSSVDNPYMGILNTLKSANDSPMRKAYKMFNNFLTRFQINDYVNARAAVNAMVNNGKMSKADGARLLVAVTLRSVVYIALGKIVVEAMLSAIVKRHPEEEDDRSYMEITGNALASSMTTLMLGRAHGNLLRGVIGMGVEDINEKHLDFMRRGAYDPSRDAIQFGLIPKYTMDNSQGFGVWDVIKSMSGPFNPMLNTIDNALKASTKDLKEPDAIRRAEQTLMIRTPFELLGNRGWIPAYGDIRKIIVADINKGIGKKAKPKEPTWRELPKSERAEIRRLDPKAADEMIKEQKEIDRINKMIRKQEQRYR